VRAFILQLLLLASPWVVCPASAAPARDAAPVLAFREVRLFDGHEVSQRTTVLVRDGVIEAVGPDVAVPEGAEVVLGEGRTLLPGLIDSHTHLRSPEDLRQALAFGVTTELEMMGDPKLAARLRKRQAEGLDPDLADLRSAGHAVTAPGGHGTEYGLVVPTVELPEELPAWVDARIAEGSDFIKIMYDDGTPGYFEFPVISEATLAAAVAAAHERDRLAVVHITSEEDARAAVEAGADGLAHFPFGGVQGSSLAALISERGAFVIGTLAVFYGICDPEHGDALADDPRIARHLGAEAELRLRRGYPLPAGLSPECRIARETLRTLLDAGVTLLVGTDAGETGTVHGASVHDELASLVGVGMSPRQALRAATSLPAERFGLEDRGVIAVGKRADLLLVDGDPIRNVTATRAIVGVWKLGRRFDHAEYLVQVREERERAAARKLAPPPPGSRAGLVSAFEDGGLGVAFGSGWTESSDARRGGSSSAKLEVVEGGAGDSGHALKISGEVTRRDSGWAGALFSPGAEPMAPANLSHKRSLSFQARGAAREYRVRVFSGAGGAVPSQRSFHISPEWGRVEFALTDFEGVERHEIRGIFIGSAELGPFELRIDDFRLE